MPRRTRRTERLSQRELKAPFTPAASLLAFAICYLRFDPSGLDRENYGSILSHSLATCIGCPRSAIRSALSTDQSEKRKTMQQISARVSFALVWAILVLTLGCASTHQTEDLLSAAGFKTVAANTPQQQQQLKTLPPHKMRRVHRKRKPTMSTQIRLIT
jgi:hypothetical protein